MSMKEIRSLRHNSVLMNPCRLLKITPLLYFWVFRTIALMISSGVLTQNNVSLIIELQNPLPLLKYLEIFGILFLCPVSVPSLFFWIELFRVTSCILTHPWLNLRCLLSSVSSVLLFWCSFFLAFCLELEAKQLLRRSTFSLPSLSFAHLKKQALWLNFLFQTQLESPFGCP